jgi:hypothetical protein
MIEAITNFPDPGPNLSKATLMMLNNNANRLRIRLLHQGLQGIIGGSLSR